MTLTAMDIDDLVWGYVTDADEHDLALADVLAEIRGMFAAFPEESE